MDSALHRIPALRRDRHQEVLQRPRELHPRQPVHPRRGARGRATSSSAPASTRSASPRPAEPAGRWPSGSSRASRPATWPPSTSGGSRRSTATTSGCATGSARCSACTTRCPGPTASWRPARPFRRSPVHHLLAGRGAASASKMGWERANCLRARGSSRRSSTPGASRTGCRGRSPSSAPPARRWRCSTRPRSASAGHRAGRARRRCSGSAPPTSTSRSGETVYTGLLNERGGYEADVTVTRTGARRVPAGQQRPPPPVRDQDWIAPHTCRARRRTSST